MIHKGQWIILPAHMVLHDKNLRLTPLVFVPQQGRGDGTICEYSFFLVNEEMADLVPQESTRIG
jgi:hypothetical protein